jgi:hypothetical protein
VRRNLERAVKERLDLVFEYYYAARDRWYSTKHTRGCVCRQVLMPLPTGMKAGYIRARTVERRSTPSTLRRARSPNSDSRCSRRWVGSWPSASTATSRPFSPRPRTSSPVPAQSSVLAIHDGGSSSNLPPSRTIETGSLVADWSVLDLVGANGAIQRIATPHAPVNLWNIHKITPNSKGTRSPCPSPSSTTPPLR